MKKRFKTRNTLKIVDVVKDLGLSEGQFYRVLADVKIRITEGQKNLDGGEVAQIRQYLNEQRRREELKRQTITIPSIVKVQELARLLQVQVGDVVSALLKNGVMATIND